MSANLGWDHMLVLLIVGLVVIGPERVPGAIRWSANAWRQARHYLSDASGNLREEFGPQFDDLREPFDELNKLRRMTPRAALTTHLLDGDDSLFTGRIGGPADIPAPTPPPAVVDASPPSPKMPQRPGSVTPYDIDAT